VYQQTDTTEVATLERDDHGRFRSEQGYHGVLDAVAEVVRVACANDEPMPIGRRRYDSARAALDNGAPSAQALSKRFGMPLASVIEIALAPAHNRVAEIGADKSAQVSDEMPTDLMLKALCAAHRDLGTIPGAYEYDTWADHFLSGRRRAGLLAFWLPHSVTITSRLGSWDHALRQAGLLAPEAEMPRWPAHAPTAPSVLESLDACIEEIGVLPGMSYFLEWCRRKDIPVGGNLTPWRNIVECVRVLRAARGASTPGRAVPARWAPALPKQTAIKKRGRARREYWTRDACLEALVYYGKTYLKGQEPRQRHYRARAKGNENLPSPSTLQKQGRFQDLCREAGL
jgi:hypothetical protein